MTGHFLVVVCTARVKKSNGNITKTFIPTLTVGLSDYKGQHYIGWIPHLKMYYEWSTQFDYWQPNCYLQGLYASWKPLNFRSLISRPWKDILTCNLVQVVQKPVNADPGLKGNCHIDFSCVQMFFTAFVLIKTEGQTKYRKPLCKVTKAKSKYILGLSTAWLPGPAAKP